MSNTSHRSSPPPALSVATQRMLAAFARHRAAERSEEAYAHQHGLPYPDHSSPQPWGPSPRSPYLRLRQDIRTLQAGLSLPPYPPGGLLTHPIPEAHHTQSPSAGPWWSSIQRPWRHSALHRQAPLIAAICLASATVFAYDVYASAIRARQATVTYVNAPLWDVITELRHRSGLDIRLCNTPSTQDRITITLTDTPVDSILHRISRQSDNLYVHWWWFPKTVLLQPRPKIDQEHGWRYNIKTFFINYTTIGCRP
jgi:hypothetical protein